VGEGRIEGQEDGVVGPFMLGIILGYYVNTTAVQPEIFCEKLRLSAE
jgi:hypothetical protein